jgi:hypothetical protein
MILLPNLDAISNEYIFGELVHKFVRIQTELHAFYNVQNVWLFHKYAIFQFYFELTLSYIGLTL